MAEGELRANELISGADALAKEMLSLNNQLKITMELMTKASKLFNSQARSQSDVAARTSRVSQATRNLSNLERERIRIAAQTQRTFSRSLAIQERGGRRLIAGQVRLTEQTRRLREEERRRQGITRQSNSLTNKFTKSLIATGAAFLSIRTAINVVKNSLKTITEFEASMSKVKAVSGATSEEFKLLEENALKLGSTTSKTASDVSSLQLEFSKLGFSSSEILAATEATIQLSIAAGSDLAESATVAASTVRGFGLSANETQRVVDVMAKSFSSSALNMEKFKVAMAKVAPVAKSAGVSLEETTANLSVLANAGLDASTAGTSLRNMYLTLSEKGITWNEALTRINGAQNKNNEALELFGRLGTTAASILADNITATSELTQEYVNAEEAAMKMAEVMEDNLAGDIDKAKSAWEGFILTMKDTTAIRGAVQAVTSLVSGLKEMALGLDAATQNKYNEFWDKKTKAILKSNKGQSTGLKLEYSIAELEEERLTRNAMLVKAEEGLEEARGRKKKDLEDIIFREKSNTEAIEKNITALNAQLDAHNEAEFKKTEAYRLSLAAKEQAAEEAEKTRTEKAVKAAEDRTKKIEAIELRAAQRKANFVNGQADIEAGKYEAFLEEENRLFAEMLDEKEEIKIEAVVSQLTREQELIIEAAKAEIEKEKEIAEAKKTIRNSAFESGEQIISDRFTAGIDERLAVSLAGFQAEEDLLQNKLDKGEITEEQYAKKIEDLNKRQLYEEAKAERKQSVFSIGLATLVAVAKAGFVTPAAAGAAVAGGIAAAAAASKPLPKLRTGVENFEGGEAYVHSNELIVYPNNDIAVTPPGETRAYLPTGTDVIPAHKSKSIIEKSGKRNEEINVLKSISKKIGVAAKSETVIYHPDYVLHVNEKGRRKEAHKNRYKRS